MAFSSDITQLLAQWSEGDEKALGQLMPLVYEPLRRMAWQRMGNERSGHTLQTTALVNELFLRLQKQQRLDLNDRTHFFAFASESMRRILIDHARCVRAARRGGGQQPLPIEFAERFADPKAGKDLDFECLDAALSELEEVNPEQYQVVMLHFFVGLNYTEIAEVLSISVTSVNRYWKSAKAFLKHHMTQGDMGDAAQ